MNVFLRDKHRGDGEHRLHAAADAAASGRAVDIQRFDLPANDLRVLFFSARTATRSRTSLSCKAGNTFSCSAPYRLLMPIRSVRVSL